MYALFVTEGPEGNRNFHNPFVVIGFHFRKPDIVPAQIHFASFIHGSVPFGARGIGAKREPVGLVAIGIQEENEIVVF